MMPTEKSTSTGIVSIVDAQTGRDLLASPEPLTVEVEGLTGVATIRLTVSPLAPVIIVASSDRSWLAPGHLSMELAAGETFDLQLTVNAEASGDYAVLTVSWNSDSESLSEHILLMRSISAASPAINVPSTSSPQKTPPPVSGPSTLPDWMK